MTKNTNKNQVTLARAGVINRDAEVNFEKRTVPVIISTDAGMTYQGWDDHEYTEVLVHTTEAIDLSRLAEKNPPSPVCLDHHWRTDSVIGIIEHNSVKIDNLNGVNRLVGTARIAQGADNDVILQKIEDGILGALSVGASIIEQDITSEDDKTEIRITKWQPLEVSLVAIPADPACYVGYGLARMLGVDRPKNQDKLQDKKANMTSRHRKRSTEQKVMNVAQEIERAIERYPETIRKGLAALAIKAMASSNEPEEQLANFNTYAQAHATDFITTQTQELEKRSKQIEADAEEGKRNAKAKAKVREEADDEKTKMDDDDEKTKSFGISPSIHTRTHPYSIASAVLQGIESGPSNLKGREGAVHDQQMAMLKEAGGTYGGGVLLDRQCVGYNAIRGMATSTGNPAACRLMDQLSRNPHVVERLQTSTNAAGLFQESLVPNMYIEALRAVGGITTWGTTVLDGLREDLEIPKQTGVTAGHWYNSDTMADVAETNATFGQVSIDMKSFAAYVQITRKAMKQSRPMIDMLLAMDLIRTFALAVTNAGLMGTGADGQPTGILNTSGVISQTIPSGRVTTVSTVKTIKPNLSDVVTLLGKIGDANALKERGSQRWVMRASHVAEGRQTFIDAGSGIRLIQMNAGGTNGMGSASLEGYPIEDYSHMPTDKIIFGSFNDLFIGFFGEQFEVREDVITNGGKRIRAYCDMDVAIRQDKAFGVLQAA